jgi:hypothetical protein
MLGLSPDSQYQPLLLTGAIIFLTGSIGVLCWPLQEAANRAKVVILVSHPMRMLQLIEPMHIIVLGLVIAAVGVGWQFRALKSPATLEKQVDTHSAQAIRHISRVDYNERSRRLTAIFDELNGPIRDVLSEGWSINSDLTAELQSDPKLPIPKLEQFLNRFKSTFDAYFKLVRNIEGYADIRSMDWQGYGPIGGDTLALINILKEASVRTGPSLIDGQQIEKWRASLIVFSGWIEGTKDAIKSKKSSDDAAEIIN